MKRCPRIIGMLFPGKLFILTLIGLNTLCSCETGNKKTPVSATTISTRSTGEGFFKWVDANGPELAKCNITRIKDNGFYKYFFWDISQKEPVAFIQDSIPVVEFISDTLSDINGDGLKDLLINGQFRNGQCPPRYAMVYCFDTASGKFVPTEMVSEIPNPTFIPSKKLILGISDCMMNKDEYKFRWKGLKPDTISDAVINRSEFTVRYHYNLDTVRHPVILETTCIMITDRMEKLKEFHVLHEPWKRRDSLINYINPAEQDSLHLRLYSHVNDVLLVDVFYPTPAMWYFTGTMNFDDKGNIALSFGDRKVVTQYSIPPRYSRIRFRIFIPKGYNIHGLTFIYK